MGINISRQKAVITVGDKQSRFNVSVNTLIRNFGYFEKRKCLETKEAMFFNFPTISQSIMQNLLDFVTKGKQYFFKLLKF